jgi:large subunit ribosomal protein L15
LKEKGVVKKRAERVKILGGGELTVKLDVRAHAFSASAVKKIEDAGGKATVLPAPRRAPSAEGSAGTRG